MTRISARALRLTAAVLFCLTLGACAGTASRDAVRTAPSAEQVDLVIQGAVDSEVEPLVAALVNPRRVRIAAWTFWRGQLAGRNVVVSRTEVGSINAVAATTLAITSFHPRLIINQGTAGATVPDLRVLDIVAGEATVDYGAFGLLRAGHSSTGGRLVRTVRRPPRGEAAGEPPVSTGRHPAVTHGAPIQLVPLFLLFRSKKLTMLRRFLGCART